MEGSTLEFTHPVTSFATAMLSFEKLTAHALGWSDSWCSSPASPYCSLQAVTFSSYTSLWFWVSVWVLSWYTLSSAVAWIQFALAWNLISRSRRSAADRIAQRLRRGRRLSKALRTRRYSTAIGTARFTDADECPICLAEFRGEDAVTGAVSDACPHVFHEQCLHAWLRSRTSCPCCRYDFCQPATTA